MASVDSAKSGAVRAIPAVGGSLFLGPTLGAPIGGYVADTVSEGSGNKYFTAGVAIGVASLFVGGASGGGGTSRGTK